MVPKLASEQLYGETPLSYVCYITTFTRRHAKMLSHKEEILARFNGILMGGVLNIVDFTRESGCVFI